MRPRVTVLTSCAALALGACTTAGATDGGDLDTESGRPFEEQPVPTIGLGSDVGRISGGTEVRTIDAGRVDTIVMIGDSITVGSTPMLEEQFARLGFDEVSITAQNSKRIARSFGDNVSGSAIAEFIAGAQEDPPEETLWVVALGTNDIGQYDSQDDVEAQIGEVLDPIPIDAPLVWINTFIVDRPEQSAEVNAAIEAALSERGNATIGRWDEIAPYPGVLRSDGVHPGTDGAQVFADLVTTTVADFLR